MKKIILYDINKSLVKEWKDVFKNISNVECKNISFEELEADFVVTAGNSYGWMTGGLDLAVRNYYGYEIQDIIQGYIIRDFNGYLPVGEYLIIPTKDKKKSNLIYAPTMVTPKKIDVEDVLYVAIKLFKALEKINISGTCAICGLGTLTGGISPKKCAFAMREAYDFVCKGDKDDTKF